MKPALVDQQIPLRVKIFLSLMLTIPYIIAIISKHWLIYALLFIYTYILTSYAITCYTQNKQALKRIYEIIRVKK